MGTINTKEIVFREDLYPRLKPNPAKIQEYSENIEVLPPIEINQHNILIDGYHRWKAHETAGLDEVPCIVIQTASEQELLMLAVSKNSTAGQQLTQQEKKEICYPMVGRITGKRNYAGAFYFRPHISDIYPGQAQASRRRTERAHL